MSATVSASAGSENRAQTGKQIGANHAINHSREDVLSAIKGCTNSGVNIYWETA